MINLLPTEEKNKINKNYASRLSVFYLYVLSACFFIASVAFLPAYFYFSLKDKIALQKKETISALPVPTPDKETEGIIKDMNFKMTLIEKTEGEKYSVLDMMINQVIASKLPDIKINQFYFNITEEGKKAVEIRGEAPNRERLLMFRNSLEQNKTFAVVDLPISNFVKGQNIDFSINLIAN